MEHEISQAKPAVDSNFWRGVASGALGYALFVIAVCLIGFWYTLGVILALLVCATPFCMAYGKREGICK